MQTRLDSPALYLLICFHFIICAFGTVIVPFGIFLSLGNLEIPDLVIVVLFGSFFVGLASFYFYLLKNIARPVILISGGELSSPFDEFLRKPLDIEIYEIYFIFLIIGVVRINGKRRFLIPQQKYPNFDWPFFGFSRKLRLKSMQKLKFAVLRECKKK